MRKSISVIICALIFISMVSISVSATSADGVLILPEDDGTGYPVTGISNSYNFDEDIVKIIVPENIVRLGDGAFYQCVNLNQIKLHSEIQLIGEKAFEGTAFYNDPDNWEKGVLYIGDCLIKADPDSISESYEIRNGTRLIAASAFKDCKNLKSITVPDTIEYIGKDAFIGTAFYDNDENWVNGTLAIDYLLISCKEDLAGSFVVSEGIKTIADGAFSHSEITEVTTPASLKHIGQDAFLDCKKLSKIDLNEKVETLGRGSFRGCDALEKITVSKDNENFAEADGVLFNKQFSSVVRCPVRKAGDIILPRSVTLINAYSFEDCGEITLVDIPKGCIFIGNSAFSNCKKLSDTILPETMEYIDNNAFSNCGIESITVPDNVNYLGEQVFCQCFNLKEITIGNGIEELYENLFESCEKLNTVTLGENINKIDKTAFACTKYISDVSNYRNGLLIAKKYLIKVAENVTECDVPYGITVIADGAFEYPAKKGYINEVHVPSTINVFNWDAFSDIRKIPVYYDGTLDDFLDITNFDWDSINLYTANFHEGVWIDVVLFGILILFSASLVLINYIKKSNIHKETEEEYGE